MLDRLEHPDDTTELLAHLRVLARHGHAGGRTARRLGGGEEPADRDRSAPCAGEDAIGGRVDGEGHPADASGRVGVRRHRHGDLVARDDHEVVAPGEQEQVGEPGPEDQVGGVVDPHGRAGRAVGEAGQVRTLLGVAAGGGDHRRRPHRRQEGTRRDGRAQRLDHDHQLRHAEPGATVGLGQVQAEPAEVGHLLPDCGQRLIGRVEQRSGLGAGAGALQERVSDAGELEVILGDRDTHESLPDRSSSTYPWVCRR